MIILSWILFVYSIFVFRIYCSFSKHTQAEWRMGRMPFERIIDHKAVFWLLFLIFLLPWTASFTSFIRSFCLNAFFSVYSDFSGEQCEPRKCWKLTCKINDDGQMSNRSLTDDSVATERAQCIPCHCILRPNQNNKHNNHCSSMYIGFLSMTHDIHSSIAFCMCVHCSVKMWMRTKQSIAYLVIALALFFTFIGMH